MTHQQKLCFDLYSHVTFDCVDLLDYPMTVIWSLDYSDKTISRFYFSQN